MEKRLYIYGDSILRATVPDETGRYRFHAGQFLEKYGVSGEQLVNRASFGATADKGAKKLTADLAAGQVGEYTLLEFGGNDCNFNWQQVADAPADAHEPYASLEQFTATMEQMVHAVRAAGSQPLLMSLPPIDGEKYLDHIAAAGPSKSSILAWLGGSSHMIYRFQEMYSLAIVRLAEKLGVPCLDVRSAFLCRHDYDSLISRDGIHPSFAGYDLIFSQIFA